MPMFRPSPKAIAVSGGLAVALVLGGTASAVADRLITSDDIKNHTIKSQDLGDDSVKARNLAPGSVSWEKSLDQDTKAQIERLVGAGEPGPVGPQGERGPAGPRGFSGSDGEDGDGRLVASGLFGFNGYSASTSEFSLSELYPRSGSGIELEEPGNYLVSMQGVFVSDSALAAPFIFAGTPTDEISAVMSACTMATDFFIPTCDATFPVTVHDGDSMALPILFPSYGTEGCEGTECAPPAIVRVAIYRMGGEPDTGTEFPDEGGCLPFCGPTLESPEANWDRMAERYLRKMS